MTASPATTSKRSDNLEIRLATIDDLGAVFHLGETLFTPQDYPNLYRTWDEYEAVGAFNSDPELFMVAESDGKVVGFAIGTVIHKARTAWDYGHLLWLGVGQDQQGRGVAKALFKAFAEVAAKHGARMLMVDTQADNEAALAFFKREGFGNPVDHVYMTLNLENS